MPHTPTTMSTAPQAWQQVAMGLRAQQWWYFLVLPAAGLPVATWHRPTLPLLTALLHGAVVAGGCLGFAYAVNGLVERHTDRDPRKNPWIGQPLAKNSAQLLGLLAAATALLAFAAGGDAPMAALTSLAAGAFYSLGPRVKARLLLGTGTNVLIFAPLLLVAPGAELSIRLAAWAATFSALLLQNQLVHEQADAGEDAAAGDPSTATWLGPQRTRWVLATFGGVAAAAPWLALPHCAAAAMGCAAVLATAATCSAAKPARRRMLQRRVVLVGATVAFSAEILASSLGLS